jgi:hypothetical protein
MPAFYGLHSAMFYCLSMHLRTLLALAIPRTKAGGSVRFKFAPRIGNHFVGTRTESFESSTAASTRIKARQVDTIPALKVLQ